METTTATPRVGKRSPDSPAPAWLVPGLEVRTIRAGAYRTAHVVSVGKRWVVVHDEHFGERRYEIANGNVSRVDGDTWHRETSYVVPVDDPAIVRIDDEKRFRRLATSISNTATNLSRSDDRAQRLDLIDRALAQLAAARSILDPTETTDSTPRPTGA